MALYISQVVIDNGLIDLKGANCGYGKEVSNKVSVEPSTLHHRKRRKNGSANRPLVELQVPFPSEAKQPQEHQSSVSLKIAAVEAFGALVHVGGSLRSDSWRGDVDHLLMEVVTNACKGGWNHNCKPIILRGSGTATEDFQLVALRAFLASILSPASVRPLYLAQGLELFLKGKQNAGTKVAGFCAQALVSLEVLIHPRALSLIDLPSQSGNSFSSGRMDFGGSKFNHGINPDVYDFQDNVNMEDGFGSELQDISKLLEPNVVDDLSDKVTPNERDQGLVIRS